MTGPRSILALLALCALACTATPAPPSLPSLLPATSAPTATSAASPTTVPLDAAWVVQSYNGRKTTIDLIDANGAGRHSPTADLPGGFQTNPDWSPDGAQLTFVATDADGHDDLWVTQVDGTDARILFDCEDPCNYLDDPAWSPDGRSIAACKTEGADEDQPSWTLVGVDVETGAETLLYEPDGSQFCAGPRWSPDGTRIVFELVHMDDDYEVTGVTLTIVALEGSAPELTALTDPALFAATADWSRSTNLIVYNGRVDADRESNDLFSISPDGGDPTRLTFLAESGRSAYEPSFDAEGMTVVFVDSSETLMRLDLDSSDIGPAFDTRVSGHHPRSRPR